MHDITHVLLIFFSSCKQLGHTMEDYKCRTITKMTHLQDRYITRIVCGGFNTVAFTLPKHYQGNNSLQSVMDMAENVLNEQELASQEEIYAWGYNSVCNFCFSSETFLTIFSSSSS